MCAQSDKAKDEWVGQLGRAIVMASPQLARAGAEEEEEEDEEDD